MESSLEKFYFYLKNNKGMSDNTLSSYKRDLNKFIKYSQNIEKEPLAFGKGDIEEFICYMNNNEYSDSSVARMICTLRNFYAFLSEIGAVLNNPMENIHKSKPKRDLPEILTGAELDIISNALKAGGDMCLRDRAIFEILYSTGVKASEFIDMKLSDVNIDIGFVSCGEGEEKRLIPIYPLATECLRRYVHKVRPKLLKNKKSDILFFNYKGEKLTRQGLWKITKRFGKILGLKKEITPHILRHTFASDLLASGARLSEIRDRLGHSDVSATYIYEELQKRRGEELYLVEHPRARMRYY